MDKAHEWTEEQITLLEQSFKDVYAEAQKEAQKRLDEYLKQFRDKDEEKRKALEKGDITKAEYKQWRKNKMLRKQQLSGTLNDMAIAYNNADVIAMRYLNNSLPMILGANFDYGASEIFGMKWSFKLYDQKTIGRLIAANPQLLPLPKVAEGKNIDWYQKKLNSAITQGILHGDSIPQIAKQLESVTDSGKAAALRNTRTAITNAECAGRDESYRMAQEDGVNLVRVWRATLDGRTRHSHAAIDGEERGVDEEFSNGCMYPGDPNGDPAEVYNCRCTILAHVKGYEKYHERGKYGNGKLGDETYDEWKERHIAALEEERGGLKNSAESDIIKSNNTPTTQPSFTPAKTKEEAVDYAKRFADDVNFDRISLDNVNAINETLEYLTGRYPINRLENITNKSSGVMSANYRVLNISGGKLNSLAAEAQEFAKQQESTRRLIESLKKPYEGKDMPWHVKDRIEKLENQLKFTRWGVHSSYDDHIRGCTIHEYGHIIADQYFGQSNKARANPNYDLNWQLKGMCNKWEDALKKSRETGDIYKLSQYANTNSKEFFAESFLAREMGEKLPDYVENLMNEVLKNGIM